ncbi:hypothetical protein Ctob_011336, partial [Chrysochromulina tobinii]
MATPTTDADAWIAFLREWEAKPVFCLVALPLDEAIAEPLAEDVPPATAPAADAPPTAEAALVYPAPPATARLAGVAVCWDPPTVYWLPLEKGAAVGAAVASAVGGACAVESPRQALARRLAADGS